MKKPIAILILLLMLTGCEKNSNKASSAKSATVYDNKPNIASNSNSDTALTENSLSNVTESNKSTGSDIDVPLTDESQPTDSSNSHSNTTVPSAIDLPDINV